MYKSCLLTNDFLKKKNIPPEIRKLIICYTYSVPELLDLVLSNSTEIDVITVYKQEISRYILCKLGYAFENKFELVGKFQYILQTIYYIVDLFKKKRHISLKLSNKKDILENIRSHSLLEEEEIPFDVKDFIAKNVLVYEPKIEIEFQKQMDNIITQIRDNQSVEFSSTNPIIGLSMLTMLAKYYISPDIKKKYIEEIIKLTTCDQSGNYTTNSKLLDTFIVYDGFCIDIRFVLSEAVRQSNIYVINNYIKISSSLLNHTLHECIKQNNVSMFSNILQLTLESEQCCKINTKKFIECIDKLETHTQFDNIKEKLMEFKKTNGN